MSCLMLFGMGWRITMGKKPQKLFAGMPKGFFKNFFPKRNPKKNPKKIFQENFVDIFFGNLKKFFSGRTTIFFRKRVAKDIDPTRIKRIKPTNKYKTRLFLEKNNYFHRKIIRVSSASSKRLS